MAGVGHLTSLLSLACLCAAMTLDDIAAVTEDEVKTVSIDANGESVQNIVHKLDEESMSAFEIGTNGEVAHADGKPLSRRAKKPSDAGGHLLKADPKPDAASTEKHLQADEKPAPNSETLVHADEKPDKAASDKLVQADDRQEGTKGDKLMQADEKKEVTQKMKIVRGDLKAWGSGGENNEEHEAEGDKQSVGSAPTEGTQVVEDLEAQDPEKLEKEDGITTTAEMRKLVRGKREKSTTPMPETA